jgi:hypothetical protein
MQMSEQEQKARAASALVLALENDGEEGEAIYEALAAMGDTSATLIDRLLR